jgi:hypothetical protein
MDTTASSFTLRKNAKRAAEAMIRKGTAPAVDYVIEPSDDGRFEIVWKIVNTARTTDQVETEIAQASADQPAVASPTEAAPQPASTATESATTDASAQPAAETEAASQPAAGATEPAPVLGEPAPRNGREPRPRPPMQAEGHAAAPAAVRSAAPTIRDR